MSNKFEENVMRVFSKCSLMVKSLLEAWEIVRLLCNENYFELDDEKTKNANYCIYTNPSGTITVSDLVTRLEINNLETGFTKNIWIRNV